MDLTECPIKPRGILRGNACEITPDGNKKKRIFLTVVYSFKAVISEMFNFIPHKKLSCQRVNLSKLFANHYDS
jgi:hypothetical protein